MSHEPRLLFVNLPVADVDRSRAFFAALGFEFDERFCDGNAVCMAVSDQAYFMLLQHDRFADFRTRPSGDSEAVTAGIYCVSAASREAVDTLTEAAFAAGGRAAKETMDMGFMYGRSFLDPDGYHWEVMWMSPEAVESRPAELADTPA